MTPNPTQAGESILKFADDLELMARMCVTTQYAIAMIRSAAMLRDYAEGLAWRPIETAPKDGTWVACRNLDGRPYCARYITCAWYDDDNLCRDPTHWSKMPALITPLPTQLEAP